jgi:hypothetical protein
MGIFNIGVFFERAALKNVHNCWNTNIYSYSETSGGLIFS